MKEFKGTKGKWVESNYENKFESTIICGNLRICEVKSFGITTDNGGFVCKDPNIIERKANAKLIESALDMFEMLKDAKAEFGEYHFMYNAIEQLLTKITE